MDHHPLFSGNQFTYMVRMPNLQVLYLYFEFKIRFSRFHAFPNLSEVLF